MQVGGGCYTLPDLKFGFRMAEEEEVAALVSEAESMALEAAAALQVESEAAAPEATAPEAVVVPGVKAEVPEAEPPEVEPPEAEAPEAGPKVVEHAGPLRSLRGVKAEQAVCLSLAGSGLSSLHGIAAFKQLWTLDLSTCGLQSVEPLLPLGSLGQLDLAGNLLDLPSALRLRKMRLGQLVLRGNPLLPTALSVGGEAEDSLLLRSVLVDALPCILALDGSFVSSAERLHCHAYIESSQGQADWQQLLRMELVSQPAARSSSPVAVGAGGAGSTESVDSADSAGCAPQAAALCALFEAGELLLQMESEARNRTDLKRLKWLAADFDASAVLQHEHRAATEPLGEEEEAADEPTEESASGPLQLCSLAQQGWLKGGRRIGLMSLLAYSLQQLVPGRLVHEALKVLLCEDGGELPAEHVSLLFSLPPCMRAALLVSLARRPIENGREASASLWRYLSIEAPLGSAAAAPNAAAAAAILAGQRACGSHLGRLLVGLPSWAAHAHEVPELIPPSRVSPPASPTRRRYVPPPTSPQHPKTPQLAPATPKTPQLWPAAPSTPQLPYEVPRPAATIWSSAPDQAPWPSTPGRGGRHPTPAAAPAFAPWPVAAPPPTPAGEAAAAPVTAPIAAATPAPVFVPMPAPPPVPAPRPPRLPERSERQVEVAHASDVWYLDPTPPQPLLEPPPAVAGGGSGGGAVRAESSAGIHADNLSWGPSFLLATSGAAANAGPPRRTGGGAAAGSVLGWSQLEAPAYLYELPHQQFVHVQYAEPPRQKPLVPHTARAPQPPAGHTFVAPPPPQPTFDAPAAPDASLPAQTGEKEGLRKVEGGPLPTSDYTGLNEGVYLQPGLGTSASAPVLPSELPPSEVAAPAGAASSCDLHAWSLTGVPEQAGGAGAGALLPGAAALEPPQDPAYASSGAETVELVADGYVLSLQELAELRQLAARGGGPLRLRTRGKDGGRALSAAEPRTFALQAALMGGREEIPGKNWFAVPGKGTFLLSQVNGAPCLGGGAPSRGRRAVDVLRREVEVQGASRRAVHRQSLQRLDLIRDGSWARGRTLAHQLQFEKPLQTGRPPRHAAPLGSRKQPPSSARLLPVRNRPDVELATATLTTMTTAASAPLLERSSSSSSSLRGSTVFASRLASGSTGPLPAVTVGGGALF